MGHIQGLRGKSIFKDAVFYVQFEANYGWDRGSRYKNAFDNMDLGLFEMAQHRKSTQEQPKVGVVLTRAGKIAGADALLVSLNTGSLHYAANHQFVTEASQPAKSSSSSSSSDGDTDMALEPGSNVRAFFKTPSEIAAIRTLLHNQMRFFRREVREPSDLVFGKFKDDLSGKGPGGKRDDLVIGVQQTIHRYKVLLHNTDFCELAQRRGWRLT